MALTKQTMKKPRLSIPTQAVNPIGRSVEQKRIMGAPKPYNMPNSYEKPKQISPKKTN